MTRRGESEIGLGDGAIDTAAERTRVDCRGGNANKTP